MPNYNDRRYRSEQLRREADGIIERHGINARTMPHIHALLDTADNFDKMNERRGYEHDDESPEMRRGRTRMEYEDGEIDMRRGGRTRSEYDGMEMRRGRSSSTGRYTSAEFHPNDPYIRSSPYHMQPYGAMEHSADHHKSKIGFASGASGTTKHDVFEDLEEYFMDFKKHQEMAKRTNDPNEKEHALLELKEFTNILRKIMSKIGQMATTPEEKQHLQEMLSQIHQDM